MGFTNKKPNINKKLSRKDIRKEKRQEKKQRKVDYFNKKKGFNHNKKKDNEVGKFVKVHKVIENVSTKKNTKIVENKNAKDHGNFQKEYELQKQKIKKLESEMKKQRIKILNKDNEEEDKTIKQLEKKLNLNRRKSKTLPKSFIDCGLDYILDVCNSENVEAVVNAEMNLHDSDSEFEEDLAFITGKGHEKKLLIKKEGKNEENFSGTNDSDEEIVDEADDTKEEEVGDSVDEEDEFNDELSEVDSDIFKNKLETTKLTNKRQSNREMVQADDFKETKKREALDNKYNKKQKKARVYSDSESVSNASNTEIEEEDDEDDKEEAEKDIKEEFWEDIYGRTRDKAGNVVEEITGKYLPPHLRAKFSVENTKKREELEKIKKQLKGSLNRLAENNIHSIANLIDEMYMKNSRNDMNETMFSLYIESLIAHVHTPERLIMEHAMLIAILQANVGTEVGAFFLQNLVKKFDELHSSEQDVENKKLDNVVLLLSHLYTFKIYNCELLYNLLGRLCDTFQPKDIDLILVILRSVGFTLRKDDPLALKQLILRIQKLANEASHLKDDSRVRFMLEVLLGIKNNNMTKLPGYDPSHAEHLKKIIKAMFRKGNYVTELKISLEDLLKADERGRWWIVGSAWTGPAPHSIEKNDRLEQSLPTFSQEILELARKQRMNTANRKTIFCILMTAEDYLDAFEKLLKLGLKGQPEQEIVHMLVHCLLNENMYNPYYALIAEQLCISDRRHKMTLQFAVWDKFKELKNLRISQITNLAKFLAHLFLQKSLPISVLKVVEFVELDKSGVRLIRQVLMSILLHEDKDSMLQVFHRIAKPNKLLSLRQSLALFLHHFILKNKSNDEGISQEEKLLKERVEQVIQVLNS